MKRVEWDNRRINSAGSSWLKLGVISSERIHRSRDCEEGLGRRDPWGSGRSDETKINRRLVPTSLGVHVGPDWLLEVLEAIVARRQMLLKRKIAELER